MSGRVISLAALSDSISRWQKVRSIKREISEGGRPKKLEKFAFFFFFFLDSFQKILRKSFFQLFVLHVVCGAYIIAAAISALLPIIQALTRISALV